MHTHQNYKTKKAFKAAATGQPYDAHLLETSMFGAQAAPGRSIVVEGPNDYHRWYAQVEIGTDGIIARIK